MPLRCCLYQGQFDNRLLLNHNWDLLGIAIEKIKNVSIKSWNSAESCLSHCNGGDFNKTKSTVCKNPLRQSHATHCGRWRANNHRLCVLITCCRWNEEVIFLLLPIVQPCDSHAAFRDKHWLCQIQVGCWFPQTSVWKGQAVILTDVPVCKKVLWQQVLINSVLWCLPDVRQLTERKIMHQQIGMAEVFQVLKT